MKVEDSEKDLIETLFEGDQQAFLAAHAQGRKKTKKWDDILVAARVHPELEVNAFELIIGILGYLPPSHYTLPHEASLRVLVHHQQMGSLSFADMLRQAQEHIKLIRNAELAGNACLHYEREIYQKYFEYLPEYAAPAKNRLTRLLGYEPQLEHSLVVEILLREFLAGDQGHITDDLTIRDIQALTVIKYRELLLSQGKAAADASLPPAMELIS